MYKRLLTLLFVVLLGVTTVYSQTLTVAPYGVTPREAEHDTTDLFDVAYNGLDNVGVGTQVYLLGKLDGESLTAPTWTITQMPRTSAAAISGTADIDTSNQVAAFRPDVAGTYVVKLTDGAYSATFTINAGTYMGVGNQGANCGLCHTEIKAAWEKTGHADMLVRGLNGTLSSHYGESCISCHTTGYYPDADNNGFDDRGFVFPDSLYEGQYDSSVAKYPNAMMLANIQCESCHGPGSSHGGETSMAVSLDVSDCAWCHDEGTHHVYPTQWKASVHSQPITYAAGRDGCDVCHSGAGFVKSFNPNSKVNDSEYPISCATCHDPHDVTNEHQLRTVSVNLENGAAVTDAGNGALCMNCHKSRRDAETYATAYHDHYGPHHGPQGDLLQGTNGFTWGEDLPSSPHMQATENACVDCHMSTVGAKADANGDVVLVGYHTFAVVDPDGNDHVEICANCHGDIGTEFSDKKYYLNGKADLDGNGTADGLQIEVQGLLDELGKLLPPYDDPTVEVDTTYTEVELGAAYNYEMIREDRSLGIHNPAYAVALLKISIEKLGGVTAITFPDENTSVPTEFTLSQNYPNPFNPTTQIQYSIPKASNVTLIVYDALGKEVKTLVNGFTNAGSHTVTWNASSMASGIYFYRIEADNHVSVKKMILVK